MLRRKFFLLVLCCIVSVGMLFSFSLAFSEEKVFKDYSVAFDSGYTIHSLFYGGLGGGVEAEIAFSGIFSFGIDFGYESFKYVDNNVTNDNRFTYIYGGLRIYMTYDAIAGPFMGVFAGIRMETVNGKDSNYFIIPFEAGWKFIIDNYSGIFVEPLVKLVLFPFYDEVSKEILNNYAFFAGANIGIAF